MTARARERPECGTWQGYGQHRRDKTDTCRACRDAWNAYLRERRIARLRERAARNAAAAAREAEAKARAERNPVFKAHARGELVLG